MTDTPALEDDTALRRRLTRIAYRMLGSVSDAEDVVQEAWLRWLAADREKVREPVAFLKTIVTRLCLNELKSARRRRMSYVGPWLPEPLLTTSDVEVADDITLPVMVALERLSPLERAAFLLHDVFSMGFEEISTAINREPAACRKLASRARARLQEARPRFSATPEQGRKLATAFYEASRSGDMEKLQSLLAEDIVVYADGGGKVPATSAPTFGHERSMILFAALARYFRKAPSRLIRFADIDGLPGFVTEEDGGIVQTTALQIRDGRIIAVYVTRNPEKLRHLGADQEDTIRPPIDLN